MKKRPVFTGKFLAGMLIYALVFAAIAGAGLWIFWQFIDAYELSRPKNTLDAYMDQLTPERICLGSEALYAQVDSNLQSREQFDAVIHSACTEEFSYAKRSSQSTQERQVYVIRCGKTPVGSFSIVAGEEDAFGFRCWSVAEESFDMSHLLGEGIQMTVPSEYTVSINGFTLDESYIIEDEIRYSALQEFYGSYALPTMVTYAAGNYLGDVTVEVTDAQGMPVTILADTDRNALLPACSQEENREITEFTEEFVELWVKFSASTNATKGGNYHRLKKVLSLDGVLADRLYSALDGLTYGQSNGFKILDITINRTVPLNDGYYMCDLTYVVQTNGRQGAVETSSSMKLMLVEEEDSLKVKAMERY